MAQFVPPTVTDAGDVSSFVISLDFELHWGVCDRDNALTEYRSNLLNTRRVIPRLLDLFEEFDVRATWATVGFLFCESKAELREHLPDERPQYANRRLSAYEYLDLVGDNEEDDPLHFAPSLIEKIADTDGQELASHTLSHYYCLEKGQTTEAFEADIEQAVRLARRRGVELKSLVFPRNQLNPRYLPILKRHGFHTYRGTPPAWMYEPRPGSDENLAHRGLRLLDAYLPLTDPTTENSSDVMVEDQTPINVAANRFLRPYFPSLRRLEEIRLRRIKNEMAEAARNQAAYHLWWHPHNFGAHIEENFDFLRRILDYQHLLDRQYGMPSMTMSEAAHSQVAVA